MTMVKSAARSAIFAVMLLAMPITGHAQAVGTGKWAEADDPVAKNLIELERTWATLDCDTGPNRAATAATFYQQNMADDFVGTSPEGQLYTKADLIPTTPPAKASEPETGCKMLSAKVRFFGPDLAVIYGSESAELKDAAGKVTTRGLIWTDTLVRRNGRWQFIAVQDMVNPSK